MSGQIGHGLGMGSVSAMPPVSSRGTTPITEFGLPGISENYASLDNFNKLCNQVAPSSQSPNMLEGGSMSNIGMFSMPTGGNVTPSTRTVTPTFTPNSKSYIFSKGT